MHHKSISPLKAVRVGYFLINIFSLLIFFASFIVLFILTHRDIFPFWVFMPGGFLVATLVAWLYWSITITYWRIWAYTRVDDPVELTQLAIDAQLIHRQGSIFNKTEIRTALQKAKILELEKRKAIIRQEEFKDDLNIPKSTILKYSNFEHYEYLFWGVLVTISSVYLTVTTLNGFIGFILISLGLLVIIYAIYKMRKIFPNLTIDHEGITLRELTHKWQDISDENAEYHGFGKSRIAYLSFLSSGVPIAVRLNEYDLSAAEMRKLLVTYRGRFKALNDTK